MRFLLGMTLKYPQLELKMCHNRREAAPSKAHGRNDRFKWLKCTVYVK